MDLLNDSIREYTAQLRKGQIQKAYKGIMTFMSGLKTYLESEHTGFTVSSLYFGYMDMTYFALIPPELKNMKLKIAVVFLHEECRFELWLAAGNRQIQADYIALLAGKDIGRYTLSQAGPGVDSIIEEVIAEQPDFDNTDILKKQIEEKTMRFTKEIVDMLK